MKTQTSPRLRVALVLLACVVTVLAAPGASAQEGPPPAPASYYGDLTVNGDPAPAGLTLTAELNGEEAGSLTTEKAGRYGGAGGFDPKLVVQGGSRDEGSDVEFVLQGVRADEVVAWSSGNVKELDLHFTGDITLPGSPGDGEEEESGSTGGGGAGGGLGTGPSNGDIERVFTRLAVLAMGAGDSGRVDFPDDAPVTRLEVTVSSPVTDPEFSTGRYADRPDDVPEPGGGALDYLWIDSSIPDSQIRSVELEFSIPEAKLKENGIDPADVALSRWHDGEWQELDTRVVSQGGEVTFRATTPGFSVFAIHAGQGRAGPTSTPTAPTVTETPAETGTPAPGATSTPEGGVPGAVVRTPEETSPGPGAISTIGALVIAALGYLRVKRR